MPTTFAKIVEAKKVDDFMKYSCCAMSENSLFLGLAHDYRTKPSKKKAIALWEIFIQPNCPLELNVDDKGQKQRVALKDVIEEMKKLKEEADKMGFFERWQSSKSRKAGPNVFDELCASCETKNEQLQFFDPKVAWGELKTSQNSGKAKDVAKESAVVSWNAKTWEPERKKLEAAGFTVKNFKL